MIVSIIDVSLSLRGIPRIFCQVLTIHHVPRFFSIFAFSIIAVCRGKTRFFYNSRENYTMVDRLQQNNLLGNHSQERPVIV